MEGYITFGQLGLLILFLLLVVCGYVIVTLKNVNAAVKDIRAILKENKAQRTPTTGRFIFPPWPDSPPSVPI